MKINLKGTKKNPLSKQLKELKDKINGNITKNVIKKTVENQKTLLSEFGKQVKTSYQTGGEGNLPRGKFNNRSGQLANAVRYRVSISQAKVNLPESSIKFSLNPVESTSDVGDKIPFNLFESSTFGNTPFARRKNKGAGGVGEDYGKAIEYGNKFMRRNKGGYRDIEGRLFYKGFHTLDATVQHHYKELLDKYEKEETKIISASIKYLTRKGKI